LGAQRIAAVQEPIWAVTNGPSTLGRFLRAFRYGHVRQVDAVAAWFTADLARHAPIIAAGEPVAYLDIADTIRATFCYGKQGAGKLLDRFAPRRGMPSSRSDRRQRRSRVVGSSEW
jgi:hypothetical protein